MKRIIVAVSLAVLSAPVLAAEVSAPFEQTQFDRGLYTTEQNASSGNTRAEGNVWAQDHSFIAPTY
jgi:hypothetical protein